MATSETKHDRALRRKRNLSSGPGEVDLSPIEAGPRIAIEGVSPELDGGRFAVKRSVDDIFTVEADIFNANEVHGTHTRAEAPGAIFLGGRDSSLGRPL